VRAVKYLFVDYDPVLHRALDVWRSDAIARFAMDGSISEKWQYLVIHFRKLLTVGAACQPPKG